MSSFSRMLIIHLVGLDSETHFLPSWSWDRNSVGGGNSGGNKGQQRRAGGGIREGFF